MQFLGNKYKKKLGLDPRRGGMCPFPRILSGSFFKVVFPFASRVPNKRKHNQSGYKFTEAIVNGSYMFRLLYDFPFILLIETSLMMAALCNRNM
jgi:hypothetical protein